MDGSLLVPRLDAPRRLFGVDLGHFLAVVLALIAADALERFLGVPLGALARLAVAAGRPGAGGRARARAPAGRVGGAPGGVRWHPQTGRLAPRGASRGGAPTSERRRRP